VLSAIDFNNQALLTANEIGDETADRNLPGELVATEHSCP
jgi:hypothetical protein